MGPHTNISLFSGAGGLDLGARLVGGFRTVAYVEFDRYAQGVLRSRMRDGGLYDAPIWDDIRTFDGKPWAGLVDCLSGGFPCQDVSQAGRRQGVKEGTRSGLWFEFARLIREIGPRCVLAENVRGLLSVDLGGGFGTVLRDLADLGYDARWFVLSAAAVGAPHRRERVWICAWRRDLGVGLAHPELLGRFHRKIEKLAAEAGLHAFSDAGPGSDHVADAQGDRWLERWPESARQQGRPDAPERGREVAHPREQGRGAGRGEGVDGSAPERGLSAEEPCGCGEMGDTTEPGLSYRGIAPLGGPRAVKEPQRSCWWAAEPAVGRVAHGVAHRVDRLRLCGNGVVPQQSVPAWRLVKAILEGEV